MPQAGLKPAQNLNSDFVEYSCVIAITSVAKGLKLKVRNFLGLTPTLVKVAGEKLEEVPFR